MTTNITFGVNCSDPTQGSLSFACYNTATTGENIITAMIVNTIIGLLCYCGFVLWRDKFPVYHGREYLPELKSRPPPLKYGGHWQLWSWIQPVYQISDKKLLETAGFDAWVSVRIIAFGCALFLPLTIFGIGVILPVNFTAGGGSSIEYNDKYSTDFLKMTISNIPNGSNLLWVHLFFLYTFVGWGCFLLIVFYQEHIALRQTLIASDDMGVVPALNSGATGVETTDPVVDALHGPQLEIPYSDPSSGTTERLTSITSIKRLNRSSGSIARIGPLLHTASLESPMLTEAEREASTADLESRGSDLPNTTSPTDGDETILSDNTQQAASAPLDASKKYLEKDLKYEYLYQPIPPSNERLSEELNAPVRPGLYTVLVIDQPIEKFSTHRKTMAMFPRLGKMDSIKRQQDRLDRKANWAFRPANIFSAHNSRNSMPVAVVDEEEESKDSEAVQSSGGLLHSISMTLKRVFVSAPVGAVKSVSSELTRAASLVGSVVPSTLALESDMRMRVVNSTFEKLFGDEFDAVIPIYDSRKVDKLITECFKVQNKADRVHYALKQIRRGKDPYCGRHCSLIPASCANDPNKLVAQLDELLKKEKELQEKIKEARKETHQGVPCRCFIATFKTAKAAAMASTLNINPVNYRAFTLMKGADPSSICWTSLQRSWLERKVRFILTLIPIILIMLFPIGAFTGIFSQLEAWLCGSTTETGVAVESWFCSDDMFANMLRGVLTGVVPSILMSVWQAVVLPIYFYNCVLAESHSFTLAQFNLRISSLFYYWSVFNYFIGSLLGGTITNGLQEAINDPNEIWTILAEAIASSSNFFINYISYKFFASAAFRLFFPSAAVTMNIFQWLRIFPKPRTKRDIILASPPRNCRYSRDIANINMAIYIAALAYAIISPFILPLTLGYFFLMYWVWRYQQLYVYQEHYRSDGQMWKFFAHRMVVCYFLMVLFTSSVFVVKGGYVLGGISFVSLGLFLLGFDKYLVDRYDNVFVDVPISILQHAPEVELDPLLYTPPPLRPGAQGWYPEWGKAWCYWGQTRYGI